MQSKGYQTLMNTQPTVLAALVASALLVMATPGYAQEAPATPGQLETVVVTANKRIEKLEKVPMAISVLTEEEIQRTNIREIEDVVALSPSLTLNSGTTAANNAIFMRGIGTVSVGIGVESDVSVIIDDIPVATQFQAFRDLADVSRIEVLRGPQSTLFGKSAVAGAINITTKPISGPMVYRGSVYGTNDGERRYSVSAGGNVSEKFGIRIALSDNDMPGNFHNLTTGQDVNGSTGKTFMGKLSWHPTANFDVDLLPRYNDQKNSRGVTAINGFFLTTGSAAAGNRVTTPVSAAGTYLNGNAQLPASTNLAGIDVNDPNNRNVRRDFPTGINSTDVGTGLKLSYTLPDDMVLMSISSIDHYKANDYRDQDFVDVPTLALPGSTALVVGNNQFGTYDIRSKTQELRLVSPGTGPFRYVAGLWWARNEIDRHFIRGSCVAPTVCTASSPSSPTNYYTDIYNVNKAIFGQASWDFAKDYTLVGGLRLNREESGFHYIRNYYTDQLDRATFVPGPVGVDQFSSTGNTGRAITGKLSLQRQLTADWMVYAMGATGYKGIAYDVTSGLKAAAAFPVTPETSQTFELGTKANLFNNRLSIAATIFNTEFFNYQQNTSKVYPNDPTIYTQLDSIPRIRTHGAEIDTHFLLTDALVVSFSGAYTLPTIELWKNGACYNDATNVAVGTTKLAANGSIAGQNAACFPIVPGSTTGVQDLSGGVFPGTPKVKANLGASYDLKLPGMPFNAFINGNVRYQSDYNTSIGNDPRAVNPAYSISDLGFGIRGPRDSYKLSFRINNLFNRFYIPNANASGPTYRTGPTSSSPAVTVNSWVPPRDVFRFFSVKLDVKF
ncbi:MAG: TonB-dependent receptor [Massilia sp.]|nr:TonB-dependent receptor [Massilia sp.]